MLRFYRRPEHAQLTSGQRAGSPKRSVPALQKLPETFHHAFELSQFTFPDDEGVPSLLLCFCLDDEVSFAVAAELRDPELLSRLRYGRSGTAWMLVPEAPMHPDSPSTPREGNVGIAGNAAIVETVAIPHAGEQAADRTLWTSVATVDPRHHLAAFGRC